MADIIFTWHKFKDDGNRFSMVPAAYYVDAEYELVAVRIYAEKAPDITEAEFDIYADGTSIFGGTVALPRNVHDEEFGDDFTNDLELEVGSWLTCNLIKDGGGKNFSVQLELDRIGSDDE